MKMMIMSVALSLVTCLTTGSVQAAPAPVPVSEAKRAIVAFYQRYFRQCGDGWYIQYEHQGVLSTTRGLFQHRQLDVDVWPWETKSLTVSETDLLNSIEWRSYANVKTPARQYLPHERKWSPWFDEKTYGYFHPISLQISAEKSQGQWEFRFTQEGLRRFQPIDCAKLPQ
jgi:hypothetical protein